MSRLNTISLHDFHAPNAIRSAPSVVLPLPASISEAALKETRHRRLVNMTLQRLRLFALALVAVAATTTGQAVERDVVGWEGARWGMNESEIKEAFSSKLLVPLAGEQPGETVLSIPAMSSWAALSTSVSVSRVPADWSGSTSPK
jgi:hypothetical protein